MQRDVTAPDSTATDSANGTPRVSSDQATELAGSIDAFLRERVYPLEATLLRDGFLEVVPALDEVRDEVRRRGWWAPHLPREMGGLGFDLSSFARSSEVMGRSPLGLYAFNCQAPDIGNMELLHAFGSEAQKARFLAPLAAGQVRS